MSPTCAPRQLLEALSPTPLRLNKSLSSICLEDVSTAGMDWSSIDGQVLRTNDLQDLAARPRPPTPPPSPPPRPKPRPVSPHPRERPDVYSFDPQPKEGLELVPIFHHAVGGFVTFGGDDDTDDDTDDEDNGKGRKPHPKDACSRSKISSFEGSVQQHGGRDSPHPKE